MKSGRNSPFLPITLGDPAGVGPRVGTLAALSPALRRRCRPFLLGDARALHRHLPPGAALHIISDLSFYRNAPKTVNVLDLPHPAFSKIRPGAPSRASGESAVASLRAAVALALAGKVPAIVTGPVSKESLKMAKVPHPGQTELLQSLTGSPRAEMLMTAGSLRGLLITRHVPLKDAPGRLTTDGIVRAVRATNDFLRRLLRHRPRWAVCGLNPHAGDNGLLGGEEKRVIRPAVLRLRALGLSIEGPLPADVAWSRHARGSYDACACLYHDQGMIPLKTLHPARLVNITVGLPFIRTSPGHGTAFDLSRQKPPYRDADPTATLEAAFQALDAA